MYNFYESNLNIWKTIFTAGVQGSGIKMFKTAFTTSDKAMQIKSRKLQLPFVHCFGHE